MSRVGRPPRTSSVGAPGRDANDLSARSATFPSSGFVSYLVRFGSIQDVYESLARSVSAVSVIGVSGDFVLNRFPASLALQNTKGAQAGLFAAESSNKVNR